MSVLGSPEPPELNDPLSSSEKIPEDPEKVGEPGHPSVNPNAVPSPDIRAEIVEATPADVPLSQGDELPAPAASLPPNEGLAPTAALLATPPIAEVRELDWQAIRSAVDRRTIRSRMRATVERMEALLDCAGGPGMLFDCDRADAADRAIQVSVMDMANPLWIVGDLHGDLLALEAALALVHDQAASASGARPQIVFLGDLFDDESFGLEVLLRIFELILEAPELICVIAGNHDEALSYDGVRFASSVTPADFSEFLNANLVHEWIERAGKLAVRFFAQAPRALFCPDGLLIAHGGFPLVDLHPGLAETGDWNAPTCLSDFVWTRAHPKARRKLPNRFSRGSQFGYEDFAAFCSLSAGLGRPVTHMVRGHDHVEERYAIYPAYHAHPVLTTVALSHRLSRERFGSYERVPTIARVVEGSLPQVYRLHIPADMIREIFPEVDSGNEPEGESYGEARI